MRKISVSLGERSYDIHMEQGCLPHCGLLAKTVTKGNRVAIVTDETVGALYGAVVEKSFVEAGYQVKTLTIAPGETSKNPVQLAKLWEDMATMGMTRSDTVVALGGGVVGDLAGFAAATLYRGVSFIQIPTTLLAQVDSSVGGKVAVDLEAGKNLAGAFYQPKLVIMDLNVLDTLHDETFADGMAEVIKYGCIWDKNLFSALESAGNRQNVTSILEDVVATCCDIKRQVVEQDELDLGLRMILNFGHTLGHVYEKAYHYETYTHGAAVAAGMISALALGEKLGITPTDIRPRLSAMLTSYGLPVSIAVTKADYEATLKLDKKASGSSIHFVLLPELGKAEPTAISVADLMNMVVSL